MNEKRPHYKITDDQRAARKVLYKVHIIKNPDGSIQKERKIIRDIPHSAEGWFQKKPKQEAKKD